MPDTPDSLDSTLALESPDSTGTKNRPAQPAPSSLHGTFGWYELMTTDTAAAGSFYSSVIGWTTHEVGQPPMPYTTFNVGDRGIAGMMTLPEQAGSAPAWIGYINVDDVDVYAKKVADAGGQIHRPPTDVPGMLRFSVVSDPQGAPFILFTPNPDMSSTPERPAPGSAGSPAWHELRAADPDSAFDFYSGLFGWTKGQAFEMGPMGSYQIFEVNGIPTGGIMKMPPQMPSPFWSYTFNVDSASAAAERITAASGKILNGPQQVPGGGWSISAIDPQGASFNLLSSNK